MKKIRVHTAFTFTHDDYSKTTFPVGTHTVKNEVADHWFTLRHAELVGKSEAGSDADSEPQLNALQAQLSDLSATNADLTEQVTSAAAGLAECNALLEEKDAQIADLTAQLAALTEKANGAKK